MKLRCPECGKEITLEESAIMEDIEKGRATWEEVLEDLRDGDEVYCRECWMKREKELTKKMLEKTKAFEKELGFKSVLE